MNRFEFGMLVASLRQDMRWTQMELAERTSVDISAISNIERGERRTLLKDNILVKLADGFQLTTMERREFLLAASGVAEIEALRKEPIHAKQQFDPKFFLTETGEHIACMTLPVLVADAFCDVVMANRCLIEFYSISPELLRTAGSVVGGYNTMRYIFEPISNSSVVIGNQNWENLALINARYFRLRTLRVRSKPYFAKLLKEFLDVKKYPSFERCWRKILFDGVDVYSHPIPYPDPNDAHAIVANESLLALTPFGELYLHQILPLNRKTAERIEEISKRVGEGYELFAPFPDKQKL